MVLFPLRAYGRPLSAGLALSAVAASVLVAPCRVTAQDTSGRVRLSPPIVARRPAPTGDRAVLGILMATGTRGDTAGVRVEEVDANGPAAKAGLKAGDIITEINGTSLTLSRDDAEDLAAGGLAQRRLQRALASAKPGDEIPLLVRSGGAAPRKLTVTTVSQAELERAIIERRPGERPPIARAMAERGMVGLTVGAAGNVRDTLGLFISSVVTGGPAEQAGIVEGERIAAVNGVDVRVPRADVDDAPAVSARVNRFVRAVQQAAPGKTLTLRVYGGGRYREVAVTAVKATELPHSGVTISVGDGGLPLLTPRPPQAPRVFEFNRDGDVGRLRLDGQEMRIDLQQLRDALEQMRQGIERGVDGGLRGFDLREVPVRARRAVVIL